jgi:hypothetical protein
MPNLLPGTDPGVAMIPLHETSEGYYITADEAMFEASISATLGFKLSTKVNPQAAVSTYNSERQKLNREYDDLRRAFVTAWSNVVVPVQNSNLGYTSARLTDDYLGSLYDDRVGSAFVSGIKSGFGSRPRGSGPPAQ